MNQKSSIYIGILLIALLMPSVVEAQINNPNNTLKSSPGKKSHSATVRVREDSARLDTLHIYSSLMGAELGRLGDPFASRFDSTGTQMLINETHGSEVVRLSKELIPVGDKNARQMLVRVPGVMVYDMDGTGNQINVSVRGLDPHRSWEFNIRQNGILLNSDLYGYPASHYNPPMEAIADIQFIHGTSALQYGAEFGGLINYVLKQGDPHKSISGEFIQSYGSWNTHSSYLSLGGKKGKWQYFGYGQWRESDGYRDTAKGKSYASHAEVKFTPSSKWQIKAEVSNSEYMYRLPGPLGEKQFAENPRQANRSRNYFSPNIWIPALSVFYQPNSNTKWSFVYSGVYGTRKSVQFEGTADKLDTPNLVTGLYAHRMVDIDNFNSNTVEIRVLKKYWVGSIQNELSAGMRGFSNHMHRRQQGVGTTGSDMDFSVIDSLGFGRNLWYLSESVALSLENLVRINSRFGLSVGMRYELGSTGINGVLKYYDSVPIPPKINHRVPMAGMNGYYQLKHAKIHGGISSAYRPVVFKDIIPNSTLEVTASGLKDVKGYNAELGIAGTFGRKMSVEYRFTAYELLAKNRLGSMMDSVDGKYLIVKKNIGDSRTKGLEMYWQWNVMKNKISGIQLFSSTGIQYATYLRGEIAMSGKNVNIAGKRVEGIPRYIQRMGLVGRYKKWQIQTLFHAIGWQFSDPINTVTPVANGSKGKVPGYHLVDLGLNYKFSENLLFQINISNIMNVSYYSKRPTMYPGPGIWPSDGRSIQGSLTWRF